MQTISPPVPEQNHGDQQAFRAPGPTEHLEIPGSETAEQGLPDLSHVQFAPEDVSSIPYESVDPHATAQGVFLATGPDYSGQMIAPAEPRNDMREVLPNSALAPRQDGTFGVAPRWQEYIARVHEGPQTALAPPVHENVDTHAVVALREAVAAQPSQSVVRPSESHSPGQVRIYH